MSGMNAWDYASFVIYAVVLVGMGVYLQKRASASIEDYFLADNKIPWWAMGISGMASWIDMTGTMVIVSFLYLLGPRGLFIELRGGVGIPLAFAIIWAGKWHRRSNCMTVAQWVIYRFGEGTSAQFARITVSIASFVGTVGMLAYMIKGAGLFLSMFFPYSPSACALVLILVTTAYTVTSGFYGVIVTDIFQSLIIWIAVILVTSMAVVAVGRVDDFPALAEHVTGNARWISSLPSPHTYTPKGYEAYHDLLMFAIFYFLRTFIGGTGTGGDPKYFGARNERECCTMSFFWGWLLMLRWPMMLGFAILGLVLINQMFPDQSITAQTVAAIEQYHGPVDQNRWPDFIADIGGNPAAQPPELIVDLERILGDDWRTKLAMVSHEGTINPELILPVVIIEVIPPGLRGLLVIAMLAAAMSTFDATVNMTAGLFTKDIYQRYLRPHAKNRELITATWVFICAIVVVGYLSAYSVSSINNIWDWIAMGLGGGLLMPSILRLYWWRFNAAGFAIGTLVGLCGAIVQRVFYPTLDPRLQFVVMASIGLIGSVVGSYCTAPTRPEVLNHFYRTTRPFGFWRGFPQLLEDDVRAAMRREHRNDLLALPFMIGWMVTLFMLPMLLMVRNYTAASAYAVAFLVCLVGIYKFWYLNLPTDRVEITVSEAEHAQTGESARRAPVVKDQTR